MRTELDHLPANKQRELERVLQILFEEFNDVQSLATGKRKAGRILKVILYGSYARGGWVDEPHTAKGYQSDFDLLIIVNRQDAADRVKYWAKAEDRLNQELGITKALRTPVNFIVHTLQEVNDGLAHGRYFFIDVAKDGIALYEADDTELHTPKPKTPEQALKMAKEYFEEWFPSAAKSKKAADFLISESGPREAAFNMHQAAERLYHCALLVCTFYTPHVHNLGFLRTQAERSWLDRRTANYMYGITAEQRAKMLAKKRSLVLPVAPITEKALNLGGDVSMAFQLTERLTLIGVLGGTYLDKSIHRSIAIDKKWECQGILGIAYRL